MSDAAKLQRTERLGVLCEINPAADPLADDDIVSFLPMANVEAESGALDLSESRRFADLRYKSYRPFRDGDVLFAKITPCMENGKVTVAKGLRNGRGYGSTEFHVLRPRGNIDAQYLRYYLVRSEFRAKAARHMTGTAGQLRVPAAFLREEVIPLPPLVEQRRIVEVIDEQFYRLGASSESLDRCSRKIASAKANPVARSVRLDQWTWADLGTVSQIQGGIQKQPKRRPQHNRYPFLRVANVGRGKLDLGDVHQIELFGNEIERYRLQTGDLLVVEGNGSPFEIGRSAMWQGAIPDCVHQNHLIRVRPGKALEARYLEWFWNTPETAIALSALASSTSGLYTLSVGKLGRLQVPVPPLAVQQEVVEVVDARRDMLDRVGGQVQFAAQKCQRLRSGILESAFRGELTW